MTNDFRATTFRINGQQVPQRRLTVNGYCFATLNIRADGGIEIGGDDDRLIDSIRLAALGVTDLRAFLAIVREQYELLDAEYAAEAEADMATERATARHFESFLPHQMDTAREDMMGLS